MDEGNRFTLTFILAVCSIILIWLAASPFLETANRWVEESDQRLYRQYYGEQ